MGEAMQRTAAQQHGTTVELVYFSSKTWFLIETRQINFFDLRLCIDSDDSRMCLDNFMYLEATLNCYTFKQSIQSRSGKIYQFIDSKSGWSEVDDETKRYYRFPVTPTTKRGRSISARLKRDQRLKTKKKM
jgi:hypothetical protein